MTPAPGRRDGLRIAVVIPCRNEAPTIAAVIADMRRALPGTPIVVCDNASSDGTAGIARAAGARVIVETQRGKGHAMRRLFADVEADVYVMLDGDGTYDAAAAPRLIEALFDRGVDMVVAERSAEAQGSYRPGHRSGNAALNRIVGRLFGARLTDMLSGYRVLSRRFVKSFPALSQGFEIETELTIHALELNMPMATLPTSYAPRPPGSPSKLRTIADGLRIIATIVLLLKETRPLQFFGAIGAALALLALGLALPVILTYLESGLVPRLPTAVLAASVMLLAFLSFTCGLILASVSRGRREFKRLRYLTMPAPPADRGRTSDGSS